MNFYNIQCVTSEVLNVILVSINISNLLGWDANSRRINKRRKDTEGYIFCAARAGGERTMNGLAAA